MHTSMCMVDSQAAVAVKNLPASAEDVVSLPGLGGKWPPTPVLNLKNSMDKRRLVGSQPQGCSKGLDMTE